MCRDCELAADVVAVTLRGLTVFGYLHHLVEPSVGERLFALFDHAARRVIFVLRDLAVGVLAADQLVRLVVGVGRGFARDSLAQDVARRIVHVFLDLLARRIDDRKQLADLVVQIGRASCRERV